jgi:hypothetical protein
VIRSNEYVSFNIINKKAWRARQRYNPLQQTKTMADGSNKEETGSQRTRQSTRNEVSNGFYKRCAYTRGNNKDKSSLQGNLAELGNNVYQYGT